MKKSVTVSLLITIISLGMFLISTPAALAWDDCPFGKVDDPYPGDCARYIDTDNDGICDHSQPAPEDRIAAATNTGITNTNTVPPVNSAETVETPNTDQPATVNSINTTATASADPEKSKTLMTGILAIIVPLAGILGYALWKKR